MANSIVFDYEKMTTAVTQIKGIAGQYKNAATKFKSDFDDSIANWEGESKQKMVTLIDENIMTYLNGLEKAVNGLAELLQGNATQMQKADESIGDSISKMMGSST